MSTEPTYPASFYAKLFNLTDRRVQQLAKDGIIPKSSRGKYPLVGAIKGYVTFLQERALSSGEAPAGDLQTEKIRLTKANADKTELEVEVLKGTLIPAERVEQVVGDMISSFRAKILSIPTKSAHALIGLTDLTEVQSALEIPLYEALEELADYSPPQYGISVLEEDHESNGSASEDECEPMG